MAWLEIIQPNRAIDGRPDSATIGHDELNYGGVTSAVAVTGRPIVFELRWGAFGGGNKRLSQ